VVDDEQCARRYGPGVFGEPLVGGGDVGDGVGYLIFDGLIGGLVTGGAPQDFSVSCGGGGMHDGHRLQGCVGVAGAHGRDGKR